MGQRVRSLRFWRIVLVVQVILCISAAAWPLAQVTPVAAADPREMLRRYPVIPAIRGKVAEQVRSTIRLGQQLGNRRNVFSKIGDSITAWSLFLTPVGSGGLRLGEYERLASVVEFFSRETARVGNSFVNESLAAFGGWTSTDLLDPAKAAPGVCNPGETPLACELRLTRPAVALIMIGTNDLPGVEVEMFRANLDVIAQVVRQNGVVPVLSTLPYRMDSLSALSRIDAYNLAIVDIAALHALPLWNYWLAMEPLPANGLSIDLVHPSGPPDNNTAIFEGDYLRYGWNVRNLTALQVLERLLPFLR